MFNQRFVRSNLGFTLFELLIVIVTLGILAAILAPTWTAFSDRQRLNQAQGQVNQLLHEARSNATHDKITWQVSFRQDSTNPKALVQVAVHPADASEFVPAYLISNDALWQELPPNIRIDETRNDKGKNETSIVKHPSERIWRVQFNYYGCPVRKPKDECGQTALTVLGRLTLRSRNGGKARRCVVISTILGAMRKGKEHSKADSTGKYCY